VIIFVLPLPACQQVKWSQAVYPLWWSSLTKDMQTEQLLCWSGMTDTEHALSGSNKEEEASEVLPSYQLH